MNHEKKCWPASFQAILEGKKTFDIRLADWTCKPGDILILKEYDPEKKAYTGRTLERTITYISTTKNWNVWPTQDIEQHGFQILALQEP